MKYIRWLQWVGVLSLLLPVPLLAEEGQKDSQMTSLYIQAVRVRGEEFVAVKNMSNELVNLANYKLQYFNNYNAAKATSSKLIDMSTALLPPGSSVYLITESIYACSSMMVNGVSLGFTDKQGMVQVVEQQQASVGGPVEFRAIDSFAWSNDEESEVQPLLDEAEHFYWRQTETLHTDNTEESEMLDVEDWKWVVARLASDNACELQILQINNEEPGRVKESEPKRAPLTTKPTSEPPATIISTGVVASASSTKKKKSAIYPARSIGLAAPQLSELMPNPGSPGKDANDEYVELYNSNDKIFELSGFALEFGVTSVRKYTFPEGTLMKPKSFMSFYSGDTSISLTNSVGQVKLLDPYGNIISETDQYEDADDDNAWTRAEGVWQWSSTPTPDKANVVTAVGGASGSSSRARTASSNSRAATNGSGAGNTQQADPISDVSQNDSVHPLVLAAVGTLTIGYALYEYRQDIVNKIEQLKRIRENRRANRKTS